MASGRRQQFAPQIRQPILRPLVAHRLEECEGKQGDSLYENPDAPGAKFCDSCFAAQQC